MERRKEARKKSTDGRNEIQQNHSHQCVRERESYAASVLEDEHLVDSEIVDHVQRLIDGRLERNAPTATLALVTGDHDLHE